MCTVLLPPGVNPIAVDKYIISYSASDRWWMSMEHWYDDTDGANFHETQGRQCTYTVTLRRFRATIVAVEKQ